MKKIFFYWKKYFKTYLGTRNLLGNLPGFGGIGGPG